MKAPLIAFDGPARLRNSLLGASRRPAAWAALAIATIALASSAFMAWEAQRLRAMRDQLTLTADPIPAPPAPSTAKPLSTREVAAWNEAVLQLNTPWPALLATLEAATPSDVALVSIEPDARSRSVRVVAEAKSLDTLLLYAQQLQGRGPVIAVMPARHETNDQDANKPVRMQLQLALATGLSSEGQPTALEQQR